VSIREILLSADRNIDAGKFSDTAQTCITVIQKLEGSTKNSANGLDFTDADGEMTLLAGVITRLLSNSSYNPSNKEVHQYLLFKRALSQVFELSKYRSSAHLTELIGDLNNEQKWVLTSSDICRLLMGISINDTSSKIVDLLKACDPRLAFLATIAFLSEQFTWSKQAEEVRSQLVRGDFLRDDVQLEDIEFKLLASAWMGCSYADASHKHEIKDRLNSVVRNWLKVKGVEEEPGQNILPSENERPRLLIIAELYYRDHAMDRCYGAEFRSLRKHFHTTFMMAAGHCDPVVADQFDEVDSIEFKLSSPEKFIAQARKHNPDIVYFPSVGMRIGGIACANVRLAPIQIATLGHPATTRSALVDYIILLEDEPACFTETLLLIPGGRRFLLRSDAQNCEPDIRRNPKTIRLAVPAWVRKLTPGFLNTCNEIKQKSVRPVEFWFFPNVRGSLYLAMKRRLEGMLPSRVFPSTSYNQYIASINKCDIHLSSFPFGATNGIVDSARQGLPLVNMSGVEPHSQFDREFVQYLNQPDWLSTTNTSEYIDAVVRLVDDNDLRVKISEAILDSEPDAQFLMDDDDATDDFVNIFLSVYRNHNKIQTSDKRVWQYDELLGMASERNTLEIPNY
jgi:hypothetical protein